VVSAMRVQDEVGEGREGVARGVEGGRGMTFKEVIDRGIDGIKCYVSEYCCDGDEEKIASQEAIRLLRRLLPRVDGAEEGKMEKRKGLPQRLSCLQPARGVKPLVWWKRWPAFVRYKLRMAARRVYGK